MTQDIARFHIIRVMMNKTVCTPYTLGHILSHDSMRKHVLLRIKWPLQLLNSIIMAYLKWTSLTIMWNALNVRYKPAI